MKLIPLILLSLMFAACNKSDSYESYNAPVKEKKKEKLETKVFDSETIAEEPRRAEDFQVQITVLNFLTGGLEKCDLQKKIYRFSNSDDNRKVSLCKNSKIEVVAVSDQGVLTFKALSAPSLEELAQESYVGAKTLELGEDAKTARFEVRHPFGFTYVRAEDVTGVDTELLKQWNDLNETLADLRAEAIDIMEKGEEPTPELLEKIHVLEEELAALGLKIEETKTQPVA